MVEAGRDRLCDFVTSETQRESVKVAVCEEAVLGSWEREHYEKHKTCFSCKQDKRIYRHYMGGGYKYSMCGCGKGSTDTNIVCVL